VTGAAALVLPLIMGGEALAPERPPLLLVRTAIVVNAPPEVVWPHVVAFPELPRPTEWLFRTGVAYPIGARIEGAGVGAVRHCEFTTGPFVEPITVWEPPRRLAFRVASQPDPMEEWTLWGELRPAHVENGYFASERGEFRLTPLPGGRTRLEGTTWYRHRITPTAYWRVWSDWILHAIHQRVLSHVKARAEGRTELASAR
jgi:hypothetical protein